MDLKNEIRKLIELQEVDSRIYTFRQDKDVVKPERLREMEISFQEKKESLSSFEEKLKSLQLKRKDREIELASKEENLRKAQGQLYQLKTNKEYQAKLTEIGSLKADISVAEEEVLKVLDELEGVQKKLDQQKLVLADEEKKYKEQQALISGEIKDLEAKINNLASKRKLISEGLNKAIITKYEHLLRTRGGSAAVSVKDNNCGACHMKLTHQKINQIKMYDNLVFCENCVRILYIPEDLSL